MDARDMSTSSLLAKVNKIETALRQSGDLLFPEGDKALKLHEKRSLFLSVLRERGIKT